MDGSIKAATISLEPKSGSGLNHSLDTDPAYE